ncbi:MAG: MFS transporter [Armatimonadetes bacterium]|nr:MFS transporter [Armatimonadota bacterium]
MPEIHLERRRRLPWALGFVIAAAVCDGCGIANYLTAVLWLDRDQHARQMLLGFLASVSTIVYTSTVVLIGSVADRVGPRRMTCAGAVLMALGNALLIMAGQRSMLILGMACKGLAAAMFWPALASWLGKGAPPHVLPRRLAAYNLGWCGGQVVGLAAAGWLYGLIGALPSFGVYSLMYLGLAVGVWWLPEPSAIDSAEPGVEAVLSSAGDRLAAWLTNFGGFFVLFEVRAQFAPYARDVLGFGGSLIGICNALVALVQVAVFYYLGLRRPDLARGRWLLPTQALVLITLLLSATLGGYTVLLVLPAIGLLVGAANTASLYHSISGRDDAARQSGIHETVLGLANVLGPVLGGAAADRAGQSATWWLGAGVTLTAMVLAIMVRRREA